MGNRTTAVKNTIWRLRRAANRAVRKLILYLIHTLSLAAFFSVLHYYASTYQFQVVGILALSPMAILIGFSGLMYNRTRAIDVPSQRFRSLYVAERTLSSCVLYLSALVIGFVVTVLLQPFSVAGNLPDKTTLFLIYSIPMMLCLWSFGELSFALLAASKHRAPAHYKTIARRVRRLQNPMPSR